MRLSLRLSFAIVAVLSIVLVIDGYYEVRRQVEIYEQDTRTAVAIQTRTIAAAVRALWVSHGTRSAAEVLQSARGVTADTQLRWLGPDVIVAQLTALGIDAAAVQDLARGHTVVRFVTDAPGLRHVYGYSPVPFDDGTIGAVEMSRPLLAEPDFVLRRVSRAAVSVVVLALCAWLIAMIFGSSLVGRPVAALVAKARRAGGGDFSGPLVTARSDELGTLASAVNEMCAQLDAAKRQVERETQARLDALSQVRHADRLTTVGRLAAGLAHEVGTPLNVIRERVRMDAAEEIAPCERAHNDTVILEQLDRITGIIRGLLDFSRQRTLERIPSNLVELVTRAVEMLAPLASKSAVTLHLAATPLDALERVDPLQIQQVLTNLMLNGIQAMPHGGTLSLVLTREALPADVRLPDAREAYWCLRVRDEGGGISAADLPHVFEPFFTTKPVGEGTGLGLSVAYGIVQEHGGAITITSEPGVATTFAVYLPAGVPA